MNADERRSGLELEGPLCPACRQRRRHPQHYFCRACWFALPLGTRRLLYIIDEEAWPRLLRLHRALRDGVALNRITPGMIAGGP